MTTPGATTSTYVRADLASGKVFNAHGKELARPVNFASAQRDCLVLDTEGGSASVGPSIALGPDGEPNFLLPVSGQTPYASTFYFVRMRAGKWEKTPLTGTGHPFNSTHLVARQDGSFQAFLIAGDGETNEDTLMNSYGWGDRVEEWVSDASGSHWKRSRDLTPKTGLRYQSVKFVRGEDGQSVDDLLLFYAWQGTARARRTCWTSATRPGEGKRRPLRLQLERVDLFHELVLVLEVSIHRRETDVGDAVDPLEFLHEQLADPACGHRLRAIPSLRTRRRSPSLRWPPSERAASRKLASALVVPSCGRSARGGGPSSRP